MNTIGRPRCETSRLSLKVSISNVLERRVVDVPTGIVLVEGQGLRASRKRDRGRYRRPILPTASIGNVDGPAQIRSR